MATRLRLALLISLASGACGDVGISEPLDVPSEYQETPEPEPAPIGQDEPDARPQALVVDEPEPEPPPDPELLERQREEAARRRFEREYPNHGITFHFLARVRAEPNQSADVTGYMRRGSRFRATERVPGVGCARGWFEVPGDGYVCRGEGFLIGDEPPEFEPVPVPPSLEDALPYDYAKIMRENEPQYWHLPTEAEDAAARHAIAALQRAPEVETVSEADVEAPPAPGEENVEGGEPAAVVAAPEVPDFVRMRMRRGFYLSLDAEETGPLGDYFRSVRGGYVRTHVLRHTEPGGREGVVLQNGRALPLGFVWRPGTRRLRRVGTTHRFREVGAMTRHTTFGVAEMLDREGRSYVVARSGDVVRRSSVRIAAAMPRPSRVGDDARWIHVSLAEQTLVAYEGDTPVFATTTSTGREGFETPTGLFRIQSKHVSTTMDDLTSEEDAYLIEDVPWTMYFEGNFAIHAAFWHEHFGRPRSHGCVNLAPADARWVFQWAGPELPDSWHGVFASRTRGGTWIYITEQ